MHMHIGIDARLVDGHWGGVQQFVIGLAAGLCSQADIDMRFSFFMYEGHTDWLAPYVTGTHAEIVTVPYVEAVSQWKQRLRERVPALRSALHTVKHIQRKPPRIDALHPRIVEQAVDLMHFPFQRAETTDLPTIYHPWDLQHRHLSHLFSGYERFVRDYQYAQACEQASIVSVASQWVKADVVQAYGILPGKVQVTPMGSVLSLYPVPTAAQIESVRVQYALPERFIFYPAKRWPHKNHSRLLKALHLLRDRYSLRVPLVLSGSTSVHDAAFDRQVRQLTLEVIKVGYVDTTDLAALYRMAQMLVFPSLFEGWGLPITEALSVGLPVACTNLPVLVEQVGEAALTFDPLDSAQIADAVRRLWQDDALHQQLSAQALARSERFSWQQTAAAFIAQYQMLVDRTSV